jgi:hypothetical protein
MSSKTVLEHAWSELTDASGKIYNVKLDLTVKEMRVDERTMPVARAIAKAALSRMSAIAVPDGNYTLTYLFDGKPQKEKVRIVGGTLLAG